MEIPEGEEKVSGTERILPKIMAENFSNLVKDTNLYNNQAE